MIEKYDPKAEAELLRVGLSAYIGQTKKEIRKKLTPLLLAWDFFLTERQDHFSITVPGNVEVLRIVFRDGVCIDQTLLVTARLLYRVHYSLRRLDGFVKDEHKRLTNGSCVWRVGRVMVQDCAGDTYHVRCRRLLTHRRHVMAA